MKKFILLAVLVMAGVSAYAQWSFASVGGVYVTMIENISPKGDIKNMPGFQAGLLSEYKFRPTIRNRRIGIQTSLLLVRKEIAVQAEYQNTPRGVASYTVTQTAFSNFITLSPLATTYKTYEGGELYMGIGPAYYQPISGKPAVKEMPPSVSNEGTKFNQVARQDYKPHFTARLDFGFRQNCGFSYRVLLEYGLNKNTLNNRAAAAVGFGAGYFF